MTNTPYFDAYERGERSASYIVAKYDIPHRRISYASPRYNGSILYDSAFIYCPYIPNQSTNN